ncbi:MAG: hypothetical protein CL861_01090 [Cyanobium sp. MED843]|nr:hypothetical protein [Cyanobium sp. MED843]
MVAPWLKKNVAMREELHEACFTKNIKPKIIVRAKQKTIYDELSAMRSQGLLATEQSVPTEKR